MGASASIQSFISFVLIVDWVGLTSYVIVQLDDTDSQCTLSVKCVYRGGGERIVSQFGHFQYTR